MAAVRFRPGAGAAVLGLPLHTLRDDRATLAELWGDDGRRLEQELAAALRAEHVRFPQDTLADAA